MKTPLVLILPLLATLWSSAIIADQHPNFVFIIGDDISWDDFGCYGNESARTPHVDQLAAAGLRFTNAYLTTSSCSPSRSSIITGRYPHNLGAASELHRGIAWHLIRFPALLREQGYYTVLSGKNHMPVEAAPAGRVQSAEPFDVVDPGRVPGNSGGHGNWVRHLQERPRDRPFFFWLASHDAHRPWDADAEWNETAYGPRHSPAAMVVPSFLVDDEATREDLASYHNEVTRLDHFVGQVFAELERQEILENTLLIVMADNGRPFPRAKTRLHDSGMQTALVAHWPLGIGLPGQPRQALVSAIDLAPTVLEAAGVPLPESVQGVSLLPIFRDPEAEVRRYAFSEHNWHDYQAHARSVRDRRFLYIINHRPDEAWQGPADSVRSPSHRSLQVARDAGRLTLRQQDNFLAPRPREELYSLEDREQATNLAADPEHAPVLRRLRGVMRQWEQQTADSQPTEFTQDAFDRETGERLPGTGDGSHFGVPPGADKDATQVNHPGPR